MSLRIDWNNVRNKPDPMLVFDERLGYEVLNQSTQTVGFMMIVINMGEITEANWKKFFRRIYAWEKVNGPMRVNADGPVFTTAKEVYDHIGLRANVQERPESTFKTDLVRNLYDDADHEISKVEQELNNA